MFDRVPLSLPQSYVIEPQILYLSNAQGLTTISMIYVSFYTSVTGHLGVFIILLTNLLLFSSTQHFLANILIHTIDACD